MAQKYIDGRTDEDWALANHDVDSDLSHSPPRFAQRQRSREALDAPDHGGEDDASLIMTKSVN